MPDKSVLAEARCLRAIDLFCGAGGLSEGLRAANYEIPFALDGDADSCETYRKNHPGTHVECRSITTITAKQIAKLCDGPIDLVVGGPSCQSFSTAGRKNGWVRKGDDRTDLWLQMLKVVETLKPKAFLLENVPGLVYWKEGQFGARILRRFRKLGYAVSRDILLAANYGVPQRRRRVVIVGILGEEPFAFPEPTHLGGWRRDTLKLWEKRREEQGLLPHIRTWEAIGDLPPLLSGTKVKESDPRRLTPFSRQMRRGAKNNKAHDHEPIPVAAEYLELIKCVPQGGTWRDIPPHLLPDRYRGMRRTDSTNLLGRLDPDLPAYTITTQFNNVTTGCYTHPYEDRPLSVREAARLQTFPDRYQFVGQTAPRCRQIGNAVPPLLAHVLTSAIAGAILGESAQELHPAPKPIAPAKTLPAPPASDPKTKQRMQRQKKESTKPEVLLRRELHGRGLRYRIDAKPVEGLQRRADIVFPSAKVAVFVHGCFWHGCSKHSRDTKSNTKWWADKIAANKRRDEDTAKVLRQHGWLPVQVWEHDPPAVAADRVASRVYRRLGSSAKTRESRARVA